MPDHGKPSTSTMGPSLDGRGDGGGGSGSTTTITNSLFERRKRTIHHNGNHQEDVERCSPSFEAHKKARSRDNHGLFHPITSRVSNAWHVLHRLRHSPNRLSESIQIIKSHRRIVLCILIAIPFILRPSRTWKWRYHYFGKHNIHGGLLGRRIEYYANKWTWEETQRKHQMRLKELGIELPTPTIIDPKQKFYPLKIQTQAALRELLVRRHVRGRTLVALEKQAASYTVCNINRQSSRSKSSGDDRCHIPHVMFVPDLVAWNPPRPGKVKSYQQLLFDEDEMQHLVSDAAPFLVNKWDAPSSMLDKIQIWSLCAIYHFGGVYVGGRLALLDMAVTDMLYSSTGMFDPASNVAGPFGLIVLDANQTINTIAATPRHPLLHCVLRKLEQETTIDKDSIAVSLRLSPSSLKQNDSAGWTRFWADCLTARSDDSDCCDNISSESITSDATAKDLRARSKGPTTAELLVIRPRSNIAKPNRARPVTVVIKQDSSRHDGTDSVKETAKLPFEARLQSQGLRPGWLCARCIRLPMYGTMEKCSRFCPNGYTDFICHSPDVHKKVQTPLDITVQGGPLVSSAARDKAIPRIIHQTWFEDVDLDRYPQLGRLRNGWKNTGWEYRLYTDVTARKYIEDYFPARFVEAFDVLKPGAYKADLFRYLVLMREGGVYADIDVLLETTLDNFITPTMTFFAPRDVVAEHANEPYCLWNGLIGAAPAHPFIVKTVERVINLILERADLYDMERDLCRNNNDPVEIWKVQGQTLLLLSGPCALGVAMNTVLGRPALQALEVGWIGLDELDDGNGGRRDHGDALILVVDKYDIGSFRISDPERSFVVASTNLENVEKDARTPSDLTEGEMKRQQHRQSRTRFHYSNATKGVFVWGSSGVYSDKLVANERFKLNVRYEDG